MTPLQNLGIEFPEKAFTVEMVVFGTLTHGAMRRTVTVLARTIKGAKRICKARYRRIEIKSVTPVRDSQWNANLGLFPVEEF